MLHLRVATAIIMKINHSTIARHNSPVDETTIYDPFALVVKAKGSFLWMDGQKMPYIDLLMSYSSTNFGHVNPTIVGFVKKAAEKVDNVIAFNSEYKIKLSQELIRMLPIAGNKVVYYPVGGTKAIDAAIKLAKAYTKKDVVIAFDGAFHGYSYGGMSVTDGGYVQKKQFGTLPGPVKTFPFPHRLSKQAATESKTILHDIESYLRTHRTKVAAIIFEPIQGAAGFIIPPPAFLSGLISLAQKYGVVSICDEIQTGVGRTGTFYYINQIGINPDIVLLSKSLAGGYYPLSAVIANREIHGAVDDKHSGFDSTFATNLFGIDIAYHVVTYLNEKHILTQVHKTGEYFFSELQKITRKYSFIQDLDHVGMAYGYRIVAPSNDTKDSAALAKWIKKSAFTEHLIIQTAGTQADHMKIAPNFFITKSEITTVMKKLDKVFSTVKQL